MHHEQRVGGPIGLDLFGTLVGVAVELGPVFVVGEQEGFGFGLGGSGLGLLRVGEGEFVVFEWSSGWGAKVGVRLFFVVRDKLLLLVYLGELNFLRVGHVFPLLDDFEHDFRLPHARELVLVLVVALPRELTVHSAEVFLAHLPPHDF